MHPRLRKPTYQLAEAAALLGVEPYVLRYWQTRFPSLTVTRDGGGQPRFAEPQMRILLRIHDLLHGEKYTLGQAIEKLRAELDAHAGLLPDPQGMPLDHPERLLPAGDEEEPLAEDTVPPTEIVDEIARLKAELEDLKRQLE
jgi:DNA-binding transcriptional MerR regulator